jgi:hypothetical protein
MIASTTRQLPPALCQGAKRVCRTAGAAQPGVPHSSQLYRDEWEPSSANSASTANSAGPADSACTLFPAFLWADDAQLVPHHQLHRIDFQVRKDFFPVTLCDARSAAAWTASSASVARICRAVLTLSGSVP